MPLINVAVLPVGGQGLRLRSITGTRPKVLTKLDGIEILAYPLLALVRLGVSRIYLVTADSNHAAIEQYVRGSVISIVIPRSVVIHVVNACAQATAKATLFVRHFVSEPFFYLNGDVIAPTELLTNILGVFNSTSPNIAAVAASPHDVAPTHPHFVIDRHQRLLQVQLSGGISPGSLCSMETAIFTPQIFDYLASVAESAMTMEALSGAIQAGSQARVCVHPGFWYHLAVPSDLALYAQRSNDVLAIARQLGLR